ncbi:MAG: hypothetical protein HZA07_00455 [Nitrospirae bacterium]|nr:hypothetical protein [Nitrospirota bacterium]
MTNKEKQLAKMGKKQQRLEAGLISEHFPEVSSIVINMKNYQKGINPIPIIRAFNFWPTSYAYFNIECLSRDCVDGGFDLDQVITTMIRCHKELGEGELVCDGNNLSSDHSSIHYKVTIQYNKKS